MSDVIESVEANAPAATPPAKAVGDKAPPAKVVAAEVVADAGKKPAAGSIASGAETVAPQAPPDWPTDWREKMAKERAGDDEKAYSKELKRLKELTSPVAVWAKAAELESRFGAGGLVKIPGAKATDEEKAAYFKAIGVPEKPEDYAPKIKLANNRVLGDADKPVLDSVVARLHPLGVTPSQMSALVDWKLDYDQARVDQREEQDGTFRVQSETALRKEWGADYKAHATAIATLVADWPPEVRDIIDNARDGAGNKLGDHPAFLKVLQELAIERVPAGQNYGADGTNPSADRLAEIRTVRRNDPAKYEQDRVKYEAEEIALIDAQKKQTRGSRAA